MPSPRIVRARGRSRRTRLVALLAVSVLAAPAMPAAAAPDPGPAATPPVSGDPALVSPAAGQVDGTRVTLITGDVIVYREHNGEPTFSVEPAPRGGGPSVFFQGEGDADNFYVYPSDVEGHIGVGVLDRELFNIPALIRQGLDDQATGGQLPVLVTFAQERSTQQLERDANALPAADHALAAEAVQGAGVMVDRDQAHRFRDAVLRRPVPGGQPGLARGLEQVRLDRVLEIDLDESVPQIGAPAGWDAGFTGQGITVAVLDTGVDAGHPDLAGQVVEQANFTDEPDATDGHGHGTHVASTIAGTGAASGGQYTGVAPSADLLSGKVCDSEGDCQESAIIAGMQWATSQGADIVNMSLGGEPTDGTDPLSLTLNQLSADTDTLFVVSAGNNRASFSVGSPGSADAALTVAAVDKTDRRAGFSSRGPRVGDFAVKPNITAPGVDIVAARAAGTSMGTPVDDHYTAANGTSMSAPHVTGAAALLAQAKPDLSASALKDTLASTSADVGQSMWWAGTGRVDVAAALTQNVYGPASVDFGSLTDQPAQKEVVYTNHGDTPITMDLAATLNTWSNDTADGLTLAADTLTVPANGQASITATADPESTGRGVFEGLITATADDVTLRTAVGFGVNAGAHTVTIRVVDSQGNPYHAPTAGGSARQVWLVNDTFELGTGIGSQDYLFLIDDQGVAAGQVPPGTYTLMASPWEADADTGEPTRVSHLVKVEADIRADTTVILDARTATRLDVSVPRKTEVRTHTVALHRPYADDLGGLTFVSAPNGIPVYATPTPAGKLQRISLFTHWTLAEPQPRQQGTIWNFGKGNHNVLYSDAPAYIYNLPFGYENGIPDNLHHKVTRADLVEVPTRYHADDPDVIFARQFEALPAFGTSLAFDRPFIRPGAVTEYFLADDQISWRRVAQMHTSLDAVTPGSLGMLSTDRFLEAQAGTRRSEDRWFDAPLRYGAGDIADEFIGNSSGIEAPAAFSRGGPDGDQFVPGFWVMDNSHGHGGTATGANAFASWRMWNLDTGTELEPSGSIPTFSFAPGEATYRLEKTWAYPAFVGGLFHTKSASTTVWTFKSRPVTSEVPPGYRCQSASWGTTCEFQPIIQLRYDFELDLQNRAPAGRAHVVTVNAGSHSRTPDRAPLTAVTVEYSTDDGNTWSQAKTIGNVNDGLARVVIQHPPLAATDGYVAIRTVARDSDGNSVEQTIQRAYILR